MTQIQFNNALIDLENNLKYYAVSLTSDKQNAEDLLQETMLKALKYRHKYRKDTNFKAWMFTIMRNTFINSYRKKTRTREVFDNTDNDFHLLFLKDHKNPGPDSSYRVKQIRAKIDELEPDYKTPFKMFLNGYKYKEIAEELDLPLGTVKSRIFFSRKKLEQELKEFIA
ncbi:MAG: RNA polymerase sigma factor [Prolixibacteraceae bacterium]